MYSVDIASNLVRNAPKLNLYIFLKMVFSCYKTSIEVSKSSGPDKLPGRLLQSLAKEITPVVHFIFT